MKKQFLVPLILGLAITSANASEKHAGHHSEGHHSEGHHHKTVSIAEGQPVPNVDLIVREDSMRGWNLEIQLDNFELAPEMVNGENEANKGHAHLYVNGEKVTRIYGNWYYLPTLPPGTNEVKIGLNTNSHESLMYQGELIEDMEIIEVN